MHPPVTFTVDFVAEGVRTLTTYVAVPKPEFHLAELRLHAVRSKALRWTTEALLGEPQTATSPATGNFAIGYTADGGAKWSDSCSQDGIPQDAADLIVSEIRAALAPLAKYAKP